MILFYKPFAVSPKAWTSKYPKSESWTLDALPGTGMSRTRQAENEKIDFF